MILESKILFYKIKFIMKITLKNFKCYTDKEFDFGDTGLVLLSGKSGCGKSTIMQAIYFALFGTGSKLLSFGKKSCSVTITFDGMIITRSKTPNHLIVNDIYEDDAAQEIINTKFGDTFKVTGYIEQNAINSFIRMSPADKLAFLEKFAFKDTNLNILKNRSKSLIKDRKETLIKSETKLEMFEHSITEFKLPAKVEFPVRCKKERHERITKNEIIKVSNYKVRIKKANTALKSLNKELRTVEVFTSNLERSKTDINSYEIELKEQNLLNEKIKVNPLIDSSKYKSYKSSLKYILSNKDISTLSERVNDDTLRLDNLQRQEMDDWKNSVKDIENGLWNDYTEDDLNETISTYTEMERDVIHLNSLKKQLQPLVDTSLQELEIVNKMTIIDQQKELLIKLEGEGHILECPKCETSLVLKDEVLILSENKVKSEIDISQLSKDISKNIKEVKRLQDSINTNKINNDRTTQVEKKITFITNKYEELLPIDEIKDTNSELQSYLRIQLRGVKELSILEKKIEHSSWSKTILELIDELKRKKKLLNELELDITKVPEFIHLPEETLRDYIKEIENNMSIKASSDARIKKLTTLLKKSNDDIDRAYTSFHKSYSSLKSVSSLEDDIEEKTQYIVEQEQGLETSNKILEVIQEYNRYTERMEEYNILKDKRDESLKLAIDDRKKLAAADILKNKILEAESIAIKNIVETINEGARIYLECFFPDDPIAVNLLAFKTSKKAKEASKPQINIQIEYKSMEADLSMLSGGELSRVILAYTLALGDIFNTPLLLLDESTASLDQEMSNVVFDGLREHFLQRNKIVLIVAHQVVTGVFDRVTVL